MLFCLLRLHCVFIESEYLDVGSGKYFSAANQPAIILIFKNLGVLFDCMSCLFWACFCLANAGIDCRGCFCD